MNCEYCVFKNTCQVKYLYELGIFGYSISKKVCEIVLANEKPKQKPFRFEFETTVDDFGKVALTKNREQLIYQMTMSEAGKRVRVVIEEIE